MNILCIETSASLCSVALLKSDEIFYCENTKSMAHAEVLANLISECCAKAKIEMNQLNAVALSGGPGSYTGLRIGCSSAKGICYALNIPLIIIDTLKIIAFNARDKNKQSSSYWAMMDARRMEVYHAIYDQNLMQLSPVQSGIITDMDFVPEVAKNLQPVLCGDGAAKAVSVLNLVDSGVVANASGMCALAKESFQNKIFADVAYYEPFYLKQANITVSKS